jgi:hypothetical protein
LDSAVDLGAAGRDPYFGYARIDLFSALSMPCVIPVGGTILEPDRTQLEIFEVLVAVMGICLDGGVVVTVIRSHS